MYTWPSLAVAPPSMQMPGPRDIVIYRHCPLACSVVRKPWGWAHISVQKPRGARGMVTGQLIPALSEKEDSYPCTDFKLVSSKA